MLRIFRVRRHGRCDRYRCTGTAAWVIGDPDAPVHPPAQFCEECIRDMLANVPGELIDALPVRAPLPEEQPADTGAAEDEAEPAWAAEAREREILPPGREILPPGGEVPAYVCEDCGAAYTSQRALNGHRTAKHLRGQAEAT